MLWHRWLLAVFGFFAAIYGGAICMMMVFAAGGKPGDDAKLDEGAASAMGVVDRVEPIQREIDGRAAARITYSFEDRHGRTLQGRAFGVAATFTSGDSAAVEYIPDTPHINRLQKSRLSLLPDALRPTLWLGRMVFPGILALLLWFQGCYSLRRLMREGDVGVADILEVRRVPVLLPSMLSVTYSFRDHHAQTRIGRHWVRTRSKLGERLATAVSGGATKKRAGNGAAVVDSPCRFLPVIHDRRWHQKSRLTVCGDYIAPPAGPKLPQGLEAPVS